MYSKIGLTEKIIFVSELLKNSLKHTENEQFKAKHKDGNSSFSRDRLFTIRNLVIFLLGQLQRSIKRELNDFLESLRRGGTDIDSVSAAAFTKARKKLKYTAFEYLNEEFVKSHYEKTPTYDCWQKYRLFAIDGTTAEVPNTPENILEWGMFKQREDGKKICMSRAMQVYDVLNKMTIVASIDKFGKSESELLWELLPKLVSYPPLDDLEDLYILDRYFASQLLMFKFYTHNKHFCFRMKKDWWKITESFYNSKEQSRVITLELDKKHYDKVKELGITAKSMKVRLVRIELESGETEILLTSLIDEDQVTVDDLNELYAMRWGVETNYNQLKHRVQLENFSGKSINSIKQDFFVKIWLLNIASAFARPINEKLNQNSNKRYPYQVNMSNTLGLMKGGIYNWLISNSFTKKIRNFIDFLLRTVEPIRTGRKFVRPKLPKRKYFRNYCQV